MAFAAKRRLAGAACLLLVVGLIAVGAWQIQRQLATSVDSGEASSGSQLVHGRVVDEEGRGLPEVRVRIKGQSASVTTDADGDFRLPAEALKGSPPGATITAAKPGYLIGGVAVQGRDVAKSDPLVITLKALPSADHAQYRWVDP